MEALTPGHLVIVLIAFVLLTGYKKLPDATRSIGRSLRIFRSEMRAGTEPATDDAPAGPTALTTARSPEELEAEAAEAERQAAQLRARAGSASGPSPA